VALTEEEARARAEATVRAYCGWHIAPVKDETLTLDGPGTGTLMLPSLHVLDVLSITEDEILLTPLDYAWSQAGMVRRFASGCWQVDRQPRWTGNFRAVVVEITHGFTDWPPDVLVVIDRLVARAVSGAGVLSQVGAVSYATGQDGLPLSDTLSSADTAPLARYLLPFRP
jgi:hypothetical protein